MIKKRKKSYIDKDICTWSKQNISHTSHKASHQARYAVLRLCDTILQTLQQVKNLRSKTTNTDHVNK